MHIALTRVVCEQLTSSVSQYGFQLINMGHLQQSFPAPKSIWS